MIFVLEQLNRYTGKEVIAKDTVVAKLLCHDLDKPSNIIHYAPSSGPIGSGQLFKQMPNAENFIQVSPRCYSRKLSRKMGSFRGHSWNGVGRFQKKSFCMIYLITS